MLIIFDLDDTLIDTSGSITPKALERAFLKMVKLGLFKRWDEGEFSKFVAIDRACTSSKESVLKFLKGIGGERFFDDVISEAHGEIDDDHPVKRREGVLEFLERMKGMHIFSLVTLGKEANQLKKLKNAGIDSSIFAIIKILKVGDKGKAYEEVVKRLGFSKGDTIVCGDRIALDLEPAKLLGLTTVHMRFGRGKNFKRDRKIVDHEICSFSELETIVNRRGRWQQVTR